jgi:hypothetical protein
VTRSTLRWFSIARARWWSHAVAVTGGQPFFPLAVFFFLFFSFWKSRYGDISCGPEPGDNRGGLGSCTVSHQVWGRRLRETAFIVWRSFISSRIPSICGSFFSLAMHVVPRCLRLLYMYTILKFHAYSFLGSPIVYCSNSSCTHGRIMPDVQLAQSPTFREFSCRGSHLATHTTLSPVSSRTRYVCRGHKGTAGFNVGFAQTCSDRCTEYRAFGVACRTALGRI